MLTQGESPEGSEMDLQVLREFFQGYIAQPATAIFRAIELPALMGQGIQQRLGIDIGCGEGKAGRYPANPDRPQGSTFRLLGLSPRLNNFDIDSSECSPFA